MWTWPRAATGSLRDVAYYPYRAAMVLLAALAHPRLKTSVAQIISLTRISVPRLAPTRRSLSSAFWWVESATVDEVTWLDGITAVIALGGVAVAVLSWVVSRGSREEARRSADAAEVSAKAARDSAREAAAVAAIERERDHDRLGPGPVPDIAPKLETNRRGSGGPDTLFGTITLPRDYRVRAFAVRGNSSSSIGLDLLLHAGRPLPLHHRADATGSHEAGHGVRAVPVLATG